MAQVNPLTRELLVKLVYYGPGLGGKTTSLQHVHGASPAEARGQLVSLATPVDRTLYFDFLPLRARQVRGHHVRLQLFTVPGQVYFNATRKLVLTGADGLVFVADSQPERLDANLESLENLAANLAEQGRSLDAVPLVLQLNKRDLPGVLSEDELRQALNPRGRPQFGTVATTGEGVIDALDRLVDDVLDDLEARGVLGEPEKPRHTPAPDFGPVGAGLEDALEEQLEVARAASRPIVSEELAPAPSFEASEPPPAAGRAHGGESAPSWTPLFPRRAAKVRAIEAAIGAGRWAEAIQASGALAEELLHEAADRAGLREPTAALLAPWLGVEGPRWLAFRRLVRRAREGGPLNARDTLTAFAVVLQLRLALDA
ncbi:MAG TPA: ADP-ribosylation factor-like protein [Polyangiaceae bacterium LLY-WYZ-15_(1-7)]|nr:hypothetical protein [Sandaracinus sp.]HJL05440.1 ADP-ribosylation factor-like protein [Polyangiaceae bacterium LLY-WYZ-15_(1-7)]HJL12824.1 ADP-ribosylation factor-like protein [Polyangiaceae bacterium LLY-WYZ-15_(1-7)]HJL24772.1 ADP-ribosylation factor-like protein [Polyangiaceae bacterium LLY-WYZ-15_(1-7)]